MRFLRDAMLGALARWLRAGNYTVPGRAVPGVLRDHRRFFLCRGCGRDFRHGSRWRRIGARLGRVL